MRWVLDTNVAIAGLLWAGPPHRLLELAIEGRVALFSSPALLDELEHTLHYPKFAKRIAQANTSPSALAERYAALVALVTPDHVPRVVPNDIDDDQVIACAVAAKANLIVSGDRHLLDVGERFQDIPIVSPAEALRFVGMT